MEDAREPLLFEMDEWAEGKEFEDTLSGWWSIFPENPPPVETRTWLDDEFMNIVWVPYEKN